MTARNRSIWQNSSVECYGSKTVFSAAAAAVDDDDYDVT
jgi:hypothetical protein